MKAVHEFDEEIGQARTWSETEVAVVGIVITTVPIYVADLDEGNTPRVTPVEIVAVRTGREGRSDQARMFVAHETALERIVTDFHNAADKL